VLPWHEDDRFWEMRYELMFGASRWANAPVEVDQLLALVSAAPPVHSEEGPGARLQHLPADVSPSRS
jgi:hypothetical protein